MHNPGTETKQNVKEKVLIHISHSATTTVEHLYAQQEHRTGIIGYHNLRIDIKSTVCPFFQSHTGSLQILEIVHQSHQKGLQSRALQMEEEINRSTK